MQVESTRVGRVRAFETTPTGFRRIAVASAVALYLIVVSGAVVRVTSSGLGCESWPGCEAGAFFPAGSYHGVVEFSNRVFALFPIGLSALAWVAAWRAPGLPRWVAWTAAATFLGTIGQAPLGLATIRSDLHPVLVLSHFLLALLVLAGGVLVALEALRHEHGRAVLPPMPRLVRAAGIVLVTACAALVVTGTLATAAGPHSGGDDISRLGNLPHAVYVHVRATAAFGIAFLVVFGYLAARRRLFPRVFLLAASLLGLLGVQMILGEVQWRTRLPWGVVLVHVGLAAAVWATTVILAAVLWRPPAWLAARRT